MFNLTQIVVGLSLLVLIGCEIWVFLKLARGISKSSFLLLSLSLTFILSGYLWVSLKVTPAQSHLSLYLLAGGIIFTPPLWILFSSTLAREDSKAELKKGILSSIPFFILSLLFLLWQIKRGFILVQKDIFGDLLFYFADRSEPFLIFLLVGAVLSILNLEKTFHSCIQTEKKRLVFPLVFSLALLVLLIYLVTSGFLNPRISRFTFLSWGGLGILWVISLTQYLKEEAASIQITRQMVYSSAVVIIIGGYLILVGVVAKLIQQNTKRVYKELN